MVKDDETGLTFQLGNPDDLNSKIMFMANNLDKTEAMGKNARGFVEQELTAEKYYKKLIEIYQQLVNKNGGKNKKCNIMESWWFCKVGS
jgi:glycosyltransferase involved in cell wall biosynthesis